MTTQRSEALVEEARKRMPGGVNSPVRAFQAVGGTPRVMVRGRGAYLWDADGNRYVDFVLSWGPMILGHAHPEVTLAVMEQLLQGSSFGTLTEVEIDLARLITEAFPFVDRVRMVNSGTEATMSALRLARAYTGRDGVVKFAGCYHGHADSFLVEAGSGALTFGVPSSPGVPRDLVQHTYALPYNDLEAVKTLFERQGEHIAAVIVEPVAGNMGVVLPQPGFLEGLRSTTRTYGALLIFDEVITGFRLSWGGASTRFSITPDLVTLGKIIGGGFPVGAYAGPEKIMRWIAPEGPVYQAGTLSGNPVAMQAGLATLEILRKTRPYDLLEERRKNFTEELEKLFRERGIPVSLPGIASMFSLFFRAVPPRNLDEVRESDTAFYARLFHALLEEGVYLAPSAFEAAFLSTQHTEEILHEALEGFRRALKKL